jgi:signal transduction histidine kinase
MKLENENKINENIYLSNIRKMILDYSVRFFILISFFVMIFSFMIDEFYKYTILMIFCVLIFVYILIKLSYYNIVYNLFLISVYILNIYIGITEHSAYDMVITALVFLSVALLKDIKKLHFLAMIEVIKLIIFHLLGILVIPVQLDEETGLALVNNSLSYMILIAGSYFFSLIICKILIEVMFKQEQILKDLQKSKKLGQIFLANMSHDLRTPLNSIIGFSNIIEDQFSNLSDSEIKELVNDINTNGNFLLDLINELLDISKIERGNNPIEISEFNLEDLINDLVKILSIQIKNNKIELQIKYTIKNDVENDFVVHGDYKKIKQILLNVVSNAIKALKAKSEFNDIGKKN